MFRKLFILIFTFALSALTATALYFYYFTDNDHLKKSAIERIRPNEGKYLDYYDDGTLRAEENYENGKKHGIWKRYYPDGGLKDIVTYDHGKLTGEKKHFSITGQLVFTESYKSDILVDMKIWDDSLYKYESNVVNHGKHVYQIDCSPCHEAFDNENIKELEAMILQRDTLDIKFMVLDSLHKPYLMTISTTDSTLDHDNCLFVFNKEYDLYAVMEYIKKHKLKKNVKPVKMRKLKIKSKTS